VEWFNELTHNYLTLTLVRIIEDFIGDLEEFLDVVMVGKTLKTTKGALIGYYNI
jgi:hypothetical protein